MAEEGEYTEDSLTPNDAKHIAPSVQSVYKPATIKKLTLFSRSVTLKGDSDEEDQDEAEQLEDDQVAGYATPADNDEEIELDEAEEVIDLYTDEPAEVDFGHQYAEQLISSTNFNKTTSAAAFTRLALPNDVKKYLASVRRQAQHELPTVSRAAAEAPSTISQPIKPSNPYVQPAAQCDPRLLPSEHWVADCVDDFNDLRVRLIEHKYSDVIASTASNTTLPPLPLRSDTDAWLTLAIGSRDGSKPGNMPTLSIVDQMEQVTLRNLLISLSEVLRGTSLRLSREYYTGKQTPHDGADDAPEVGDVVDGPAETSTVASSYATLDRCVACWLYTLLAKIEIPLHDYVNAELRTLYRSLARMRKIQPVEQLDDNTLTAESTAALSSDTTRLVSLHTDITIYCNILMTVIKHVFHQDV